MFASIVRVRSGHPSTIRVRALTPERWDDLAGLFGPRGAYSGCWCMWWRVSRSAFERQGNAGNRRALKRIVDSGAPTGVLAYRAGRAVGWCSIAPRQQYSALERSRTLKRVDDEPVWSIVCFFVPREERGAGIASKLLEGAVAHASARGASIVEAYPVEPTARGSTLGMDAYMGPAQLFHKAGFVTVRRGRRPVVRYVVRDTRRARRRATATQK